MPLNIMHEDHDLIIINKSPGIVVHPGAGNIGGGGFMVIRLENGDVTTIDFRELAPSAAFRDMFLDDSLNVIPGKSWSTSWAAGVHGSVDGFGHAHEKYGSMPWWQLVSPAADLALKGFELDFLNSLYFNSPYYNYFLSQDSEAAKIFTKQNDVFSFGEKFVQKDLSSTLKRISRKGHREFYEGKTAKMIMGCMKRTNGLISLDDLKAYKSIEREPI